MFTSPDSNNKNEVIPDKNTKDFKKLIHLHRKLNLNKDVDSYLNTHSIDLHLLDEMEIGVYLFDYFQSTYFYVNNYFSNLTGISKSEIKAAGLSILSRLVHDDDLPTVLDISRRTAELLLRLEESERTSCCFKLYYRMHKADGSYVWVLQMNKYILTHNDDSPIDMGYILCLPEQQTTPRVAGFLTTKIRNYEISGHKSSTKRLSALTRRELEVLRWVASGIKSSVIAMKLDLSVETVKLHRRNILRKLDVKDSLAAIRILEEE